MWSFPKIGSGEALAATTRERRERMHFILIDLIRKQMMTKKVVSIKCKKMNNGSPNPSSRQHKPMQFPASTATALLSVRHGRFAIINRLKIAKCQHSSQRNMTWKSISQVTSSFAGNNAWCCDVCNTAANILFSSVLTFIPFPYTDYNNKDSLIDHGDCYPSPSSRIVSHLETKMK